MTLERQSIEKRDFPIGRRGYDPDAVDAHLQTVAEEIEELKRTSRRRTETLASAASEQVRAIVEAAETSAAEIQRQAEEEARDIRVEASTEAKLTRDEAVAQARDYVGKVSESTTVMLQRLDAMESELGALVESLRTGANRLNADLQLLEGNLGEVNQAVTPRPRFEPEPAAATRPPLPPADMPAVDTAPAAAAPAPPGLLDEEDDLLYEEQLEEELDPLGGDLPPDTRGLASSEPGAGGQDDSEGARLIALNMALNGTSREETDRYLADNFQLGDRRGLLDEVYASVEG